jgi:hydroxymethylglutaryl-CoA lyase
MLDGLGIRTGVDLEKLLEASAYIEPKVGHSLPSRYYRATRAKN